MRLLRRLLLRWELSTYDSLIARRDAEIRGLQEDRAEILAERMRIADRLRQLEPCEAAQ